MEIKGHTVRVDDEVWGWLNSLPGKMNDGLRAVMMGGDQGEVTGGSGQSVDSDGIVARLDLLVARVDGLPEIIHDIVEDALQRKIDERAANRSAGGPSFNPASIPGIQTGAGNLRQPRESGAERAQREGRERQDRARAMDSTDDPSIDRSDEFVSV